MKFRAPIVTLLLLGATPAWAQGQDPAAARAHLEQGYELKKNGQFADAYAHLVESVRLDPTLKALLNLADCEEHIGKLADAQKHWLATRDRAGEENRAAIRDEAESRLAALTKRLPKLTVRLARTAPPDTEVTKDGTALAGVSLGLALPADPGAHAIVARAKGRAERRYDVTLQEGQTEEIEVEPGAPGAAPAEPALAPSPTPTPVPAPGPTSGAGSSPLRMIGLATAGVGVVGMTIGALFGLQAKSRRDEAGCPSNVCTSDEDAQKLRDAQSSGNFSTVFFVAGGVLAAAGVTLWLVAPSAKASTSVAWDGMQLRGAW